MTIIELTKEEVNNYIDALYSCFPTGREFEIFLNSFLSALGFEEVVTTQYVGDKGVDLTCIKTGLDVNGTDTINYYVQAKRYARNNKVQAKEVRDLKGTTKRDKNGNILNSNYINVFITTSTFTIAALDEASDNPNMPVITIDGSQLIQYCIEKGIGFNYKLNIDKTRRYFGGVTEFYKKFGLLTDDGIFISKKAKWRIDGNKIVVDLLQE